jgi:hypothetical protein
MWKLLAPGVGLVDFLTPVGTGNTRHFRKSIVNDESDER